MLSELKDHIESINPLLSVCESLCTQDHIPLIASQHEKVGVVAVNLSLLDLGVKLDSENVLDIDDLLL